MLTIAQQEERLKGIGSSDAPIIWGLSSYKTPYQLFLEKTSREDFQDEESELQEMGHIQEPVILTQFALRNETLVQTSVNEDLGFKIDCPLLSYDLEATHAHPLYDFMRCNLDGYAPELRAVVEAKIANTFMAKAWDATLKDGVPLAYLIQVAHAVATVDRKYGHEVERGFIPHFIGGMKYGDFVYERDHVLEDMIIERNKKFWDCVLQDREPTPTTIEDLRIMFKLPEPGKIIEVDKEIDGYIPDIIELKRKKKEIEDMEKDFKFKLQNYMKDAVCLHDNTGRQLATWNATAKGGRTFRWDGIK